MSRFKECPKCGQDISDSYQPDEYDVGIVGGWYCDKCEEGFADEGDSFEDDIHPGLAGQVGAMGDKCPKCLGPLEMGFGLAGGGYGPYTYCPIHGVIHKSQDPT